MLANIWFILIGVLLAGYALFDGFDLGVGMLYPFLGKTESDKSVMRRSIGPLWDGNEVWLLTAGGALFAAFPPAYATVFSGFYLALMLLLFGLIMRAASIEFRHSDPKWAKFWDWSFFLGSAVPALLFGVAVGNIVRGLPLTEAGEMIAGGGEAVFGANLLAALNPYSIVIGVLGIVWVVAHGAAWLAKKTTGDLQARSIKVRNLFAIIQLVMVVIAGVATKFLAPDAFSRVVGSPVGWVFVLVLLGASIAAIVLGRGKNDLLTFFATSAGAFGLIGVWAAAIFPYIVPALPGSAGEGLTVAASSSSDLALTAMLIIAVIGVPLVLYYHYLLYVKTYAGKIEPEESSTY